MEGILVLLLCFGCIEWAHAQPTPGVWFTPLGGNGTIQQVVAMPPGVYPTCTVTDPCQTVDQYIPAHPLAPFDQEVSLQLRGPMNVSVIAVYERSGNNFNLVSYWEQGEASLTSNITFLSNSGDWSICQGNALGYTGPYANSSSSTPQILNGWIAEGLEITVMSGTPCNNDCGFYRGVGYHGWAGDKIIITSVSMPHSIDNNDPAVWSLNADTVRTAQYGCNCHASGCGEFDIAEVVPTSPLDNCYMTLYSYNGNRGTQAYFPRPVDTYSTYFTHYSETDNKIFALDLPWGCFPYSSVVPASYVEQLESITVSAATFPQQPNTNAQFNCTSNLPYSGPTQPPVSPSTVAPSSGGPPYGTTSEGSLLTRVPFYLFISIALGGLFL